MRGSKRIGVILMLVAVVLSALAGFAAPPAFADRCEVTELVVRAVPGFSKYEEPGEEYDKPQCAVMDDYVYPVLCPNDNGTLVACINSIVKTQP